METLSWSVELVPVPMNYLVEVLIPGLRSLLSVSVQLSSAVTVNPDHRAASRTLTEETVEKRRRCKGCETGAPSAISA